MAKARSDAAAFRAADQRKKLDAKRKAMMGAIEADFLRDFDKVRSSQPRHIKHRPSTLCHHAPEST
jgi:hypothetical protein